MMLTTINLRKRKPLILKLTVLLIITACVITAGTAAMRLHARGATAQHGIVTATAFDARGLDPVTSQPTERQPAYTASWTYTATSTDGQRRVLQTTTRYQRADGIYKLVHTYQAQEKDAGSKVAGSAEVYFGFNGLGVFRLDRERGLLIFVAPLADDAAVDVPTALREEPRFDREEDVRGQPTHVLRMPAARGGGYTEEYRAPALGGLLIKRVEETPQRGRQVMEPTELVMGEPDARLFAELDQYPTDYAYYERKIVRTERDEGHEAAQIMRRLMSKMQAVRPARR
jgi:hypothetical protein